MIIVTGAAGFIGSNLIQALNRMGRTDIIAVGDLSNGRKYRNLAVAKFADYMDYEDFLHKIETGYAFPTPIEVIFHEGACSTTTEWDGRYMMRVNYEYSKHLLHYCMEKGVPLIYASSAAVYGRDTSFDDNAAQQFPLNVYGYSKWQFDQYVMTYFAHAKSQIVGLRYFNVYGPHEQHKGNMASVAFHLMSQLYGGGIVRLFEGCEGYGNGEQQRDFISVDDVVNVNLWFWQNPQVSGIFNCGTGQARQFNDMANTLLKLHGTGKLEYVPFPEHLQGAYQSFTQANISKLREVGYDAPFLSLEEGLERYYAWYSMNKDRVLA